MFPDVNLCFIFSAPKPRFVYLLFVYLDVYSHTCIQIDGERTCFEILFILIALADFSSTIFPFSW